VVSLAVSISAEGWAYENGDYEKRSCGYVFRVARDEFCGRLKQ